MDLAAFILAGVALVVAVFASLEARRANDRADVPDPPIDRPARTHLRRIK